MSFDEFKSNNSATKLATLNVALTVDQVKEIITEFFKGCGVEVTDVNEDLRMDGQYDEQTPVLNGFTVAVNGLIKITKS